MKQTEDPARQNQEADRAPAIHRRSFTAPAAIALVCLLLVIFTLFARSYRSLRDAILLERIDYVEEISAQIMTGHLFMEKQYSEEAANLANILEFANVDDLDDVHRYAVSRDRGEILLMDQDNRIVDLQGRYISLANNALIRKMMGETGVTQLFTSLNYAEDSWLFAAPIPPREIGGTVYKAVILSVSADAFRSNMTISLLDDRGASYIVGNDGRIKIKPLDDRLAFNGFNLYSSMRSQGATEEDLILLESALSGGEPGSIVMPAGGYDWLVGHTPINRDTSIVVTIPLTLTAAQTYRGLSATIILSSLSVLVVALIAILLIQRFFRRDREREKQALAVAAKSEFYSKMSHDIRTPLSAVIGLVQLAQDDADDPTVKTYLAQSLSSAKYLLGIINDVLEASRIESGKLTIGARPFDMQVLLSEVKAVTKPMLEEKALDFIDGTQGVYDVAYIGDPVRIKQILTNLLSNATKFTKPGGQVGLHVTRFSLPDGYDVVTLAVTDTGIGMSERFLGRIFTPFEQEQSSYTQQYAGSGLGLSIVHDLVKLMNGTIEVTSQLDEGSTFTVTLPLLRGEAIEQLQPPRTPQAATFSGRRILLAEDNAVNQMVASKLLLRKFNIESDPAQDGEAAVRLFADSAPGDYDMILMDVKMPNMDGLEATRRIRALPRPDAKTIPIIAVSANAYKEDVELSLAAGMDDHLPKPLDTEALTLVFQRYFHDACPLPHASGGDGCTAQ